MISNTKSSVSSLDSPQTTIERQQLLRSKKLLFACYEEWYELISQRLPKGVKPILEIGSGSGFLSEFMPGVISSDVLPLPNIDLNFDACQGIPLDSQSLRAIALVNTFHHLPECNLFLKEASRCLEPGGVLVMVEPWVTPFSSVIYSYLHHEPFIPKAREWSFDSSGPLSGSNQALPWIVFERDRKAFEELYPEFELISVQKIMPFRYLASGGFTAPQLVPTLFFNALKRVEEAIPGLLDCAALFAVITVRKRSKP